MNKYVVICALLLVYRSDMASERGLNCFIYYNTPYTISSSPYQPTSSAMGSNVLASQSSQPLDAPEASTPRASSVRSASLSGLEIVGYGSAGLVVIGIICYGSYKGICYLKEKIGVLLNTYQFDFSGSDNKAQKQ